jgi:hypothetical protein
MPWDNDEFSIAASDAVARAINQTRGEDDQLLPVHETQVSEVELLRAEVAALRETIADTTKRESGS